MIDRVDRLEMFMIISFHVSSALKVAGFENYCEDHLELRQKLLRKVIRK